MSERYIDSARFARDLDAHITGLYDNPADEDFICPKCGSDLIEEQTDAEGGFTYRCTKCDYTEEQ